jgi:hypothetical protein
VHAYCESRQREKCEEGFELENESKTHMKTQAKGEYRRRSFEKTQTDRAVLMLDNPHKTGNV